MCCGQEWREMGSFFLSSPPVSNRGVLLPVEVIILLARSLVLLAFAVHLTERYLQGP